MLELVPVVTSRCFQEGNGGAFQGCTFHGVRITQLRFCNLA